MHAMIVARECLPGAPVYFSTQTHYSIAKSAGFYRMEVLWGVWCVCVVNSICFILYLYLYLYWCCVALLLYLQLLCCFVLILRCYHILESSCIVVCCLYFIDFSFLTCVVF
jgi:hypothetical protein